jgi:phage shock protein A
MWKLVKRWWKYLVAVGHRHHEQTADPAVQLEQAVRAAQEDDRRLREQAAMVLANQRQAQRRLDEAIRNYEKAEASAGQALVLADQEVRRGAVERAATLSATAEGFADRMLTYRGVVEESERALLAATRAAEQAKEHVRANGERLVAAMREKEQLLDKLDQAKLQEQMNKATEQLTMTIGGDVPTFEEVRKRIEAREAMAFGTSEVLEVRSGSTLDAQMLEIEKVQRSAAAQAQLGALRERLGLPAPAAPRPSLLRPVHEVGLASEDQSYEERRTTEL